MGDSDKEFVISIKTTADAAGAEKTAAGMEKVTQKTEETTAAIRDYAAAQSEATAAEAKRGEVKTAQPSTVAYNAEINATAAAAMKEEKAAAAAINEAEERRNSLLSQRTAIRELQVEAAEAEAAGELTTAAALEREVTLRQMALQLQQGTVISEEESYLLAERSLVASEKTLAAERAQSALNKQLIADEEAKQAAAKSDNLKGESGRLGSGLQNLGIDRNLATAAGIGALAGMQVKGMLEEITSEIDRQRIETEKQTSALVQQVSKWSELANSAKSMGDVSKIMEDIGRSLDDLREKQAEIPLATKGWGDELIHVQRTARELLPPMEQLNTGQRAALAALTMGWSEQAYANSNAKTSAEEQTEIVEKQIKQEETWAKKIYERARANAEESERRRDQPIDQQVAGLVGEFVKLKGEQRELNTSTVAGQVEWAKYQVRIDGVTKSLASAQKESAAFEERNASLQKTIEENALGELLPAEKMASISARMDVLKSQMAELGLSAESPAKALEESNRYTGEQGIQVRKLILEWSELAKQLDEISKREGEALDANMVKQAEIARRRTETIAERAVENQMLRAEAAGESEKARELKNQLTAVREIKALQAAGWTEKEAKAEAAKTLELREQLRLKDLADKRGQNAQALDLAKEKNGAHGKQTRGLIDAEVTSERRAKFEQFKKQGFSDKEAQDMANDWGQLKMDELTNRKTYDENGHLRIKRRGHISSGKGGDAGDLGGAPSDAFLRLKGDQADKNSPRGRGDHGDHGESGMLEPAKAVEAAGKNVGTAAADFGIAADKISANSAKLLMVVDTMATAMAGQSGRIDAIQTIVTRLASISANRSMDVNW